ncbi:MAG TPA: radical SAM family heme chaperone HemW [Acidimicrobiia bacterium]|nr:radical SAM family heme chaperone HemW [Acidimicrobiia bacterium]
MTPAEADAFAGRAAAYVHIPFCSSICPYCDFAVVAGRDDEIDRYLYGLTREVRLSAPWRALDAVYFGGGTPSHVPPAGLASVLDALATHHGLAGDAELSLEANPEDFSVGAAVMLRRAGFNRISFGAQSFDESVLTDLGRRHGPDQIGASVASARAAGFDNVSLDLIYGTPGESDRSWRRSLQRAVELGTDHISAYALTVERGTPLGRTVSAGATAPDPDSQADRYEMADEVLTAAGFERYEVSNWARPGKECHYNLTVWAQGEYEAYGNGAHGFRDGRRYRNHRRLDAYLSAVEGGTLPRAGEDEITCWDAELDRLFVGLRRTVGVSHGPGTVELLKSDSGKELVRAGVIVADDSRLEVKRPLLTDAVHRSVLSQSAPIVGGDDDA